MSNLFATDKKKKIVLISIYATIAVIICLMAALLITQITKPDETPQGGGQPQTPAVEFTDLTVTAEQIASGNLVIVNAEHKWLIEDDPTMVNIAETYPDIPCRIAYPSTYKANATALKHFNDMMKALYSNKSDASIVVNTAYRSFADQSSSSTPAGESEFHTGLSFRLNHMDTAENNVQSAVNATTYKWLYEHAHEYGFIVRYPDAKSEETGLSGLENIFRYVGVAHATYIYENELCLEEYIARLREYTPESPLTITVDGKKYEVYYATANETSQIKVPAKNVYTVSGDNAGGYVVTIHKSEKLNTNAQ